MPLRKKKLARASHVSARSAAPRAPEATARERLAYPSAREILGSPELAAIVRAASRMVAASGLVIIGAAASGCADPVCASSRTEELTVHGQDAMRQLATLHVGDGIEQIGIAVGITPHPAIPVAGAMPVIMPPMPPPMPPPTPLPGPSGGTGGTGSTP